MLGSNAEENSTPQPRAGRRARIAFVVVMLALLVAQALWAALTNSATFDESEHVASGLAALRTGDFRLSVAHPPLMDMLCAIPVALAGAPPLPLDSDAWATASHLGFSNRYFWHGPAAPSAPRLILLARLPVILVSVGLALLVFVWARRLYGWPAAALALGLYCFEPNVLAHSSVATNDIAMSAATLPFALAYWRYLRAPGKARLALAGIALGVGLLAKFSGVLLLAVLPVLALIHGMAARRSGDAGRLSAGRLVGGMVVIVAIAGLVVWAGYGFGVQRILWAQGAPRLPAGQYLLGVLHQTYHQQTGQLAYLFGRVSMTGWWYYFPVAFALKTALPFLVLLAIAIGLRRFSRDEAFLIAPVAVLFAAAMAQKLNYGVRHVLPIYPLLIIFAARAVARPWPAARPRWGRALVGALAVWVVIEAAVYAPQYIPYFNELAGGPAGGSRYVIDSNLDWGQDLKRLAAWQRKHPEAALYLSYFGTADPSRYGVRAGALPGFASNWQRDPAPFPDDGWVAISANCLKYDLHQMPPGDRSWSWLEAYRPVDRAGHSIRVYRLTPGMAPHAPSRAPS